MAGPPAIIQCSARLGALREIQEKKQTFKKKKKHDLSLISWSTQFACGIPNRLRTNGHRHLWKTSRTPSKATDNFKTNTYYTGARTDAKAVNNIGVKWPSNEAELKEHQQNRCTRTSLMSHHFKSSLHIQKPSTFAQSWKGFAIISEAFACVDAKPANRSLPEPWLIWSISTLSVWRESI